MLPHFKYETYQDVRHNLALWSTPLFVAAGLVFYFVALPPCARATVRQFAAPVSSVWGPSAAVSIVALIVTAFAIEIVKVHDRIYDKYVIRWRHRYDSEFVLPHLLRPIWSEVRESFENEIAENPEQAMKRLYYPFVGDLEPKIRKNLLVRLYERITVYWLTQVCELLLAVIFLSMALARVSGPTDAAYRDRLLNTALVVGILFVANRAWARNALDGVRRATLDEIQDILSRCGRELFDAVDELDIKRP